MCEHTLLIN